MARYDEHAAWYDRWSHAERHPADCFVCAAIADLDDGRTGLVVDVGCGGFAHRQALLRPGRSIAGFDLSLEQLQFAHRRISAVAVADACRLPVANSGADVVNLTFVHTDVEDEHALFAEAARVLRPSGHLILVGPHPCFNGPFFERSIDGRFVVHPTYLQSGRHEDAPAFGDGVRRRVGFHHRTLAQVVNDVVTHGLHIRRVVEHGPDPPFILGVSATRQP